MKYTFEIMKEYEDAFKGISVYSVSDDKKLMVDFVALEELEDAQKEINEAYQRGLDAAWEAARRIFGSNVDGGYCMEQIREILCKRSLFCTTDVIRQCTINEVIEKLKAYEEKQKTDDCIEIGDEVEWYGDKYIVTYRNTNMGVIQDYDLMSRYGSVVDHVKRCSFVKTGRHFDIQKILEEMKS